MGSLLTMISVNKRALAISSVMNNLNAAVEEISRTARTGTTYHCDASVTAPAVLAVPGDCNLGGAVLAFESATGNPAVNTDQVVYHYDTSTSDKKIRRSKNSGTTWVDITSPDIVLDSVKFYVLESAGQSAGNSKQARVLITIRGKINVPGAVSDFNIQTAVTQRILDI